MGMPRYRFKGSYSKIYTITVPMAWEVGKY